MMAPMTDLSAEFKALASYRPTHKVRFVTAASLFDGHDAAINIMRRILQGMGAEVIHLGHNRSVDEVVTAALQEDVQGIAISSYQGGHVEYFKYMVDLLRQRGGAHPGVRRRRRRDRAGRDPRAAGLRRGPHLQPRGRPAHGPGRA
jgi:methylmalonyl-CoA mutase cobalamin-binding subunit